MKLHWIIFVIMTAICWGAYVPVLHQGQSALGKNSALRAFLFVGIAYFATAVILPLVLLGAGAEPWEFTRRGVTFSIIAGVVGACGALGVVYAMKNGGRPIYVAPLIFGMAPLVNVGVAMIWHPPKHAPHWAFYAGILCAAVGAGLVLRYKPD